MKILDASKTKLYKTQKYFLVGLYSMQASAVLNYYFKIAKNDHIYKTENIISNFKMINLATVYVQKLEANRTPTKSVNVKNTSALFIPDRHIFA